MKSKKQFQQERHYRIMQRGQKLVQIVNECDQQIKKNKWEIFALQELRHQAQTYMQDVDKLAGEQEPEFRWTISKTPLFNKKL